MITQHLVLHDGPAPTSNTDDTTCVACPNPFLSVIWSPDLMVHRSLDAGDPPAARDRGAPRIVYRAYGCKTWRPPPDPAQPPYPYCIT